MGKNLKKVIFSVLLLAAVIVVSPKDAKAAGKVWMAGFNDNSITIQWSPQQSSNGNRVDGYYLERNRNAENDLAGFCRYNAGNSSGYKRILRIYQTGIQTYKSCHRKEHITGQLTVFMLTQRLPM